MKVLRPAAIVGVADMPLVRGRVPEGWTVMKVQADCARRALEEAGIGKEEVDGVFAAGIWPGRSSSQPSLALSEYLGICPSYTDGTNIGGASFEAHVGHAAAAIALGLCSVALVCYGSTQRSTGERKTRAENPQPSLSEQFVAPYGLPLPVGGYAMAASRHMARYGTTMEQLAEIAVATRRWAAFNPAAMYRDPITVDDVLASEMICWPLHKLDSCLVTDGGGALVLVGADRARGVRMKPVWVLGNGEAHTHLHISQMPDLTRLDATVASSRRAFEMADVRKADLDVVELYDSFTVTVLLELEALGFCDPGEGGAFVSGQRTAPGGPFPLNTNGGGLSYAHPGMYGIFLLIEAVRQLRGGCGERQVPGARLALVNGVGGTLSSSATVILGTD